MLSRCKYAARYLIGLAALAGVAGSAQGAVVISQVYGAGGQTSEQYDRDFIELFNNGTTPVDITGWGLHLAQDFSSTSSGASVSWTTVTLQGVIQPGQYYLVAGQSQRINVNGDVLPTPDAVVASTFGILGNDKNVVALTSTNAPLDRNACPSGRADLVDRVHYTASTTLPFYSCPEGTALPPASAAGTRAVKRLNDGCTDTNDNNNDFIFDVATPRNSTVSAFMPAGFSQSEVAQGTAAQVTLVASLNATTVCNPLSALSSVTADLSGFGLSAAAALVDDGTNGDQVAGDGTYSLSFTVPGTLADGLYDVQVTGAGTGPGGAATVRSKARIRVANPPATNNLPCNAINLNAAGLSSSTAYDAVVNISDATSDGIDAGTCNVGTDVRFSVWYAFTPPVGGAIRVVERSDEDISTSRHTGACTSPVASGLCLSAEDGYINVQGGTPYLFQIGREAGSTSRPAVSLDLTIEFHPAPVNDTPCGAIEVPSGGLFNDATLVPAATPDQAPGPVQLECGTTDRPLDYGVWWKLTTPNSPGFIDIFENSINTLRLAVFTGPDCNTLVQPDICQLESSSRAFFAAQPNTTYWIAGTLSSSSALVTQPLDMTIQFLPVPANDTACGAEAIAALPTVLTPNARAASTDQGPNTICSGSTTNRHFGIWYTYTSGPGASGALHIIDRSSVDAQYATFTGFDCNNLTAYECFGEYNNDDIFMTLQPSTTYWILVSMQASTSSPNPPTAPFDLLFEHVAVPANDQVCNATVLSTLPFSDEPVIPAATPDVASTCIYQTPAQTETNAGVWYTYTPSVDSYLRVQDTASDEIMTALFTGPDCNTLAEIACDDTGPVGYDTAYFQVRAGTQYWILAGKVSDSEPFGALSLTFSTETATGACCAAGGCTVVTQAACSGQGGTWSGAFTACSGQPQYVDGANAATVDRDLGSSAPPGRLVRILNVSDAGTIQNLKVQLNLAHAAAGDLHVYLTSPQGTTIDLMNRIRGINSGSFTTCPSPGSQAALSDIDGVYVFDDQPSHPFFPTFASAVRLYDSVRLVAPSGNYQPTTCQEQVVSLSVFNGQSITGDWTLTIDDYRRGSAGVLTSWGLIVNGGLNGPCSCRADFDQQNGVQVADIFAFLRAWFANAPSADFDGMNGIQVADIFAFLRAWFAGC